MVVCLVFGWFCGGISRIAASHQGKVSSHEFESLSHFSQRLACVDARTLIPGRTMLQKKVNFAGDSYVSDEEAEISLVEWTTGPGRNNVLLSVA